MKTYRTAISLMLAFLLAANLAIGDSYLINGSSSGPLNAGFPMSYAGTTDGYRFTVGDKDIMVKQVGVISTTNQLVGVTVRVWRADTQSPVPGITVTIAPNDSNTYNTTRGISFQGGSSASAYYVNISPVILSANTTYVIGGYASSAQNNYLQFPNGSQIIAGDGISIGGYSGNVLGFNYPGNAFTGEFHLTADIFYSVITEPIIRVSTVAPSQLLIDYVGVLEESTDLLSWTKVDPQPTPPYLRSITEQKIFFRAKNK